MSSVLRSSNFLSKVGGNMHAQLNVFVKIKNIIRTSLITGFILLNLFLLIFDALPHQNLFEEKAINMFSRYKKALSLHQSWSMFAPNPSRENLYVDAELFFEDGSKEKWTFPRAHLDQVGSVMMRERIRKYSQDNLELKDAKNAWMDLSRFVSREVKGIESRGLHRKLTGIQFYQHTNYIPRMEKKFIPHGQFAEKFEVTPAFYFNPAVGGTYGTHADL